MIFVSAMGKIKLLYKKLTELGLQQDMPNRKKVTLLLYNKLLLFADIVCISFFTFNFGSGYHELAVIDTMSIMVISVSLLLNRIKMYELAQIVGYMFIPLYLLFFRIFFGSPGIEMYFLAFAVLGIYSLVRWMELIILCAFLGILTGVSQGIVTQFQFEKKYTDLWHIHLIASILIATFLIILTAYYYHKAGIKPFFMEKTKD